jgi:hypothetical protein
MGQMVSKEQLEGFFRAELTKLYGDAVPDGGSQQLHHEF